MIPSSSYKFLTNFISATTSISNRRFSAFHPALAVLSALALGLMSATQAGAITVGSSSNPGGLQSAIQTAYNNGNRQITVTPGTYYETGTLQLSGMTGLTLMGTGVTLCPTPTQQFTEAINMYNCSNCTVEGFTLAYQVPQNPQATIMDIGSNATGNYVDVQMMPGYPAPASDFQGVAYIFDQHTHQWKVGTGDSYGNTVTSGPSGLSRVYLSSASSATAVGDFLTGRGGSYHMFEVNTCTNCTLQNLTVYYGGLFQYLESGGGGNKWYNLVIEYGPTPSGASIPPLMSTEADGFHSTNTTTGPDIENCNFEGMPDDAISIHGTYYSIYSVPDSTHLIVNGGSGFNIANNDTVCVQNVAPNYYFVSDTCTTAVSIATPNGAPAGTYYELTLKNSISTPSSGSMVYSYSRCGNGFKVINNTISHNRARGVRVLASNGVVQNNTFNGTTMEAILVQPVFSTGDPEAGVAQNDQITGNTIIGTGQAYNFAAIQVDAYTPVTQNITVSGNTLQDVYGGYIVLGTTVGDTISNNLLLNGGTTPITIPSTASSITTSGNTIINNGTIFTLTPSCAPGYGLDVAGGNPGNGTNVDIYQLSGATFQNWGAIYDGNGYYELAPQEATGSRMDVYNNEDEPETNVQQYVADGDAAQKWMFLNNGNGTVSLTPACAPGLLLDVDNNGDMDGANVQIYTRDGDPAQSWTLGDPRAGLHVIVNEQNGLAIDNASTDTEGAGVQQWSNYGGTPQEWTFTPNSDGSWTITSAYSGQLLADPGSSNASGIQMIQWDANGNTNQNWRVTPNSDGSYTIANEASNDVLDSDSQTANGTPLIQWPSNGGSQQKWYLKP